MAVTPPHSFGIRISVAPPLRVRFLWPRSWCSNPARPLVVDGMQECGGGGAALVAYPGGRARSRAAGRRTPEGRYIGPSVPSLIPEKKGPPTRSHTSSRRACWITGACVISRYCSLLLAAGSTGGAWKKIAAAPQNRKSDFIKANKFSTNEEIGLIGSQFFSPEKRPISGP